MHGSISLEDELSVEDRLFGLSLFWKEVSYNFAFFHQVPDLDFDKVYLEYLTKAIKPQSTFQYYKLLMEFCALLKDGHTNIYLPVELEAQYFDWPCIELEENGGLAIVISVAEEFAHLIPLGSVLTKIDGIEITNYLRENVVPYIAASSQRTQLDSAISVALSGRHNSTVSIDFIAPNGSHGQQSLKRIGRGFNGKYKSLKLKPVSNCTLNYELLGDDVAYISLNSFDDPCIVGEFESLIPELSSKSALVIDLRFNGGGDTQVGAEILSYLTDCELIGPKWHTREHVSAYRAWGAVLPEYQSYASDNAWVEGSSDSIVPKEKGSLHLPLVILIGRNTASAAEDFLIYTNSMTNVTTIGERTRGSTGQPIFGELPGGGRFRVCAKRDTYPNGEDFVGLGIEPDIYLSRSHADILSAADTVKESAYQMLQEIISKSEPTSQTGVTSNRNN
ncbi:S41 family peptidase [Thaumasiovibrio sp. DFM-14]|uniref:S41 family peptidase n=1 Tax=Thaumasiovibrio sp. DFM-14 TaxID=3384792 RepID=UPI0039A17BFB